MFAGNNLSVSISLRLRRMFATINHAVSPAVSLPLRFVMRLSTWRRPVRGSFRLMRRRSGKDCHYDMLTGRHISTGQSSASGSRRRVSKT